MKLICIDFNNIIIIEQLQIDNLLNSSIYLKPDSAILSKKLPFFIPEFTKDVRSQFSILVKINKVGKYIDKSFAHKYYDDISLGLIFTAHDLFLEYRANALPLDIAKAFDGSALIGDWFPKTTFQNNNALSFSLTINNEIVKISTTQLIFSNIDTIIAYVSQFFTLKIGDIIFIGISDYSRTISENDILKGCFKDHEVFSVRVK